MWMAEFPSVRLAVAQQTVKYQLTLIGASFNHYLFVNVATVTKGVKPWSLTIGCAAAKWFIMTHQNLCVATRLTAWLQKCALSNFTWANKQSMHTAEVHWLIHRKRFPETLGQVVEKFPTWQSCHLAAVLLEMMGTMWALIVKKKKKIAQLILSKYFTTNQEQYLLDHMTVADRDHQQTKEGTLSN